MFAPRKFFYLLTLSAMLILCGCAYTVFGPEERLEFTIVDHERWELANSSSEPGVYSLLEFIPKGETIDAWTELVTINNTFRQLGLTGFETPRQYFEKLKALREKECPGTTTWEVIAETQDSLLYRWHAQPCLGWPEQSEIARILDGTRNRFRIAYTTKASNIPDELMRQWIDTLAAAHVDVGGSR